MSKADPEDIVTAVHDGVTVEKSFEPDDFPVPAIAFSIRSERDTAASVRLADVVPDDVAPENIGFHPKYGAEFWDVEDGRIVFQREFAPGEEYTTVYGLRGGNADIAAKFMSEPTLESVSESDDNTVDDALDTAKIDGLAPSDDEAVEPPADDEAALADDPISANDDRLDSETLGTDEVDDGGEETDPEDEVAPLDLDDGEDDAEDAEIPSDGEDDAGGFSEASEPDEDPVRSDETSAQDDQSSAGTSPEDGSLASALAAEIRADTVDDGDLVTLRDALGIDSESPSVDARIEHLQSEVSDLEAYTDALEEFLDEEGDAQTLIAEARDGHETTIDRLEAVESQLSETRSDVDERLEAVDETVDERLDSELDAVRTDLESLEEALEAEREARAELGSEMEGLEAELADVAEMRDRLTSALGGLAGGGSAASDDAADETDGDDE